MDRLFLNMNILSKRLLCLCLLQLNILAIHAQSVTTPEGADAGVVERTLHKDTTTPSSELILPDLDASSSTSDESEELTQGMKFFLRGLRFEGNTLYTREELSQAVSQFLNREVSMREIEVLTREVA